MIKVIDSKMSDVCLCFVYFIVRRLLGDWQIISEWVSSRQYKMYFLPAPFQPGNKKVLCFGCYWEK